MDLLTKSAMDISKVVEEFSLAGKFQLGKRVEGVSQYPSVQEDYGERGCV
jgi:hypothetical protein